MLIVVTGHINQYMIRLKYILAFFWLIALLAMLIGMTGAAVSDRTGAIGSGFAFILLVGGLIAFCLLHFAALRSFGVADEACASTRWLRRVPALLAGAAIFVSVFGFYNARSCEMLPEQHRCTCIYVYATKPAVTPLQRRTRDWYHNILETTCKSPAAWSKEP